jgi:hypothetical protein
MFFFADVVIDAGHAQRPAFLIPRHPAERLDMTDAAIGPDDAEFHGEFPFAAQGRLQRRLEPLAVIRMNHSAP